MLHILFKTVISFLGLVNVHSNFRKRLSNDEISSILYETQSLYQLTGIISTKLFELDIIYIKIIVMMS